MPKLAAIFPSLRLHKATGQALVTLDGRDHYLGKFGSPASRLEYERLISIWLANGRRLPQSKAPITVAELMAAHLKWAKEYYRRSSHKDSQILSIKALFRVVRPDFGRLPVEHFGPLCLRELHNKMIALDWSRTYLNGQIQRLKRMFRWGASMELLNVEIYQALCTVPGLKKGRTSARESKRIKPVSQAAVDATLPFLSPMVADMVKLQRLTGCRPAELCIMRPGDINRRDAVWAYRPAEHKTECHDLERVIFIGPKAQKILGPYLQVPEDDYIFSPVRSETARRQSRSLARTTPLSCGNRPGSNVKRSPQKKPGKHYTSDSYRRAIHRACDEAKLERWSPNRLRHSAATEIGSSIGIVAAQVVLGHTSPDTTAIYAERNLDLAKNVIGQIG